MSGFCEQELPVVVKREIVSWVHSAICSGVLEDQKAYPAVTIYYVERGFDRTTYRPGRQKRRVPAWAADALWLAHGVAVPEDQIKA